MNWLRIFLLFPLMFEYQIGLAQKKDNDLVLNDLVRLADEYLYDDPSLSLEYAIRANKIAEKLSNDSIHSETLNRVGIAHWSLGNQLDALEWIQASLQMSEKKNITSVRSRNLTAIGKIYRSSGLALDGIGYFRSALIIQEEVQDKEQLFTINNDIGRAFLDISFYDSAGLYFDRAFNYQEDQHKDVHFFLFYNMAENEFLSGNIQEAGEILDKTLANAQLNKSKSGIIRGNRLKAAFLRVQGDSHKALAFALKATEIADNSKIKELIYQCNKTLSDCYGDLEFFEEAFRRRKIYETYRDSVFNDKVRNELQLLSQYQRLFNYEVMETQSEQNRELADRRRKTIFLLGFFFLFIFGLIAVIVIIIRLLHEQKKELERLNEFKNKIVAIVSHDLKYPMQQVVGVINLFNDKLVSREEIAQALPEIKQKTENLMELISNLLQWAEGQMDSDKLKRSAFSLLEFLLQIKNELQTRLDDKRINLVLPLTDVELRTNTIILKIVLRNLITNAIKFSLEKSDIKLDYKKGDRSVKILVIDSGVGMDRDLLKKVFIEWGNSGVGTSGETGSGVGLVICKDFIQRLGGRISVESELGRGSTFTIEIPA